MFKKYRLRFLRKVWKSFGMSKSGKQVVVALKRRGFFYSGVVTYEAGSFRVRVWRRVSLVRMPRMKAELKDGFRDVWEAAEWGENQIPFRKVRS